MRTNLWTNGADLKPITIEIRWWCEPISSDCTISFPFTPGGPLEHGSIEDLMRQINESGTRVTMTVTDAT